MERDHAAVNKQALALVKKLKVTPEDNATSQALTKQAAAKRAELAKLSGPAFDKAYVDNEVAYHKTVNGALETQLIPLLQQWRAQEPAADRPEDLPWPRAARCNDRRQAEVGEAAMYAATDSILAALILCGWLSVPAHAATIQITIDKLVYAPAEVSAKVGDTVEWVNKDILAHTATARNGDWEVMIGPNKTGQVVLKKAGAVDYTCKFHPNMTGRITVAP